ncbi:unnamed protein product [Rotaria magnacalcarata]|uniref:Uncharacterized protein n=1 Tax=Rotaria magnacalcarata TaxID=392030 RepID=A0A816VWY6_9BILA|nr:unnamed protein product [Rotaria magnacalcarata]
MNQNSNGENDAHNDEENNSDNDDDDEENESNNHVNDFQSRIRTIEVVDDSILCCDLQLQTSDLRNN